MSSAPSPPPRVSIVMLSGLTPSPWLNSSPDGASSVSGSAAEG